MKTKGKNLSQLWKRNMVVAAIAVFVCAAVYLNWNYEQEVGKTLGESAMVGKEDPLVSGGGSSAPAPSAPVPPPAYAAPAGGDQFAELDDDDGELPF